MTGKGFDEASEAAVGVNVIDYDRAARPQSSPCPIHLKADAVFTVQAVMHKKIDLAELRKYAG
jgi:hypothetical protein